MAAQQSISQNPSSLVHPATADDPPPPPTSSGGGILSTLIAKRPAVRVTTEFDSEGSMYTQKISCKLVENLAKLKLGFRHNSKGQVASPQLSFISKFLSVDYDVEDENAVVKGKVDFGPAVHLKATHDVKYKQGELAMIADLAGPAYKLELASVFPSVGLPKATFKFPLGEVSLVAKEAEEEEEKVKRMLSIDGILKGQALSGICTAHYTDENLNLRYAYKDEQMSFIPSISLPSNTLSVAFKRRFGPSDKLSYLYNFDSNFWSAVYKHTVGKDYKFKAGYDSEVRLGWASLWVGDEAGKAKSAPMKTKVQFMLQVPQDEIQSSTFMFRVKKRWDI